MSLLLAFLFVLSGAAGLMYESIWSHYLGLFVGHSAYAQVIVLVIFLALVESSYAKLRLFRVPQYLGVGFVCALIALALRIL